MSDFKKASLRETEIETLLLDLGGTVQELCEGLVIEYDTKYL